jgi:hypothetical protein
MSDPEVAVSALRRGRLDPWVLDEDGIVDEVAVEIAAAGTRPVRLTPTERRLAAALILSREGTVNDIATRLHTNNDTARALARRAALEWIRRLEPRPRTAPAWAEIVADLTGLVEEALHLRMHGEYAPGGNENWATWERAAERWLRGLADPKRGAREVA